MDIAELDIDRLSARCHEHPDSSLFARLADLYLERRRMDEALALCERGTAVHPSYAAGHIMLGRCHQALGHMRKARSAYHRALELSPFNTVVQNLLVALPEITGDDEKDEPIIAGAAPVRPLSSEERIDAIFSERGPALEAPAPENDGANESSARVFNEQAPDEYAAAISAETLPNEPPAEISSERVPDEHALELSSEHGSDEHAAEVSSELFSDEAADPIPYEPFPTFEEYISLHPAPGEPTITLDDYLRGRSHPSSSPINPVVADASPVAQGDAASNDGAQQQTAQSEPAPIADDETDLESLAMKLRNAKRIVPAETSIPSSSPTVAADSSDSAQPTIVTQTMAEIYVAQNKFQAAVDAYRELIKKQPEHARVFQQRIDAIELLMGNV